uniref:RxLR effector candidate protein n=1 Tax=Hyaloperonospora arabidopsidis (strain Emoy2) TaxID=559515 RepID=M4C2L8_HYAAE
MRCAVKAATSAAVILRSAAAEEAKFLNAAGDNTPAASLGSCGDAPHDIGDFELEFIYSGELDGDTDSQKAAAKNEPDMVRPESTKSESRSTFSLAKRRDIFGSSEDSDAPSPRRSRYLEIDRGGVLVQFSHDDGNAVTRHDQRDRTVRGVGTSIDTTQEVRDHGILRVAPEKKVWLPPQQLLDRLSDTISDRCRIRLFDSLRIHRLDSSASNFRTEHESYIDVFSKHQHYSGNHKRDGALLLQACNAFIHNVGEIGRDAWLDKLTLSLNR